ncbi:MAG: trypsin-like peptidase domain-containing protein [Candidatus Uhrbacteria bacterium]
MESPRSSTFVILLAITVFISAVFGATGGYLADKYFSLTSSLLSSPNRVDENIVKMIEEESSAINVVDNVTPAVVSIVVQKPFKDLTPAQQYSYGQDYYGQSEDPDRLVDLSFGTGFLVSADGYVVTNRHVAADEEFVFSVVTNNDEEFTAEFVAADPLLDIAILKITGENFSVAVMGDSDKIQVGQTVIAIGNALSQYQNTVTKGIVSGINRRVSAYDFDLGSEIIEGAIQTDAAINPGNSGGPLINLLGEVIGMNTAINSEGQGLGFAIPINEVKQAVESVKQNGRIVRPYLGVRFLMIDKDYATAEKLSVNQGALIVAGSYVDELAVVPESPAAKAGLQEDDIILKVNDQELSDENSLSSVIRDYQPGEIIKMSVLRGEETVEVSVTLEEYKK